MPASARLNSLLQRNQNSLDFIRFAAAVGVIFNHSYFAFQYYLDDPFVVLTNAQASLGAIAVDVFFIISGFLITASIVQSQNGWLFLKSRFLRIYPALIVLVLLTMFVLGPLMTTLSLGSYLSDPATYHYLNALLLSSSSNFTLPGVFTANVHPSEINISLWSLFWEVLCYLLVFVLWIVGLLKKKIILGLLALLLIVNLLTYVFTPMIIQAGNHSYFFLFINALFKGDFFSPMMRVIPAFLAGAVFYLYRDQIVMKRRYVVVGIATMLVSILAGSGFITLWFPTFGAYILLYAASTQRSPFKRFGRYGDFSYGMYIYAFPIQQTLTSLFGGVMLPMVNFVLAVPVTLFFAVLSWHLVEKRALKLKHFSLGNTRKIAETAA